MTRTMARWTALAAVSLLASGALAQPRRPSRPARRPPHVAHATPPPAPAPSGPELISVPVGELDTMMRQMRVWLLTPPAGSTAYGLAGAGSGQRVWALLPSCRPRDPDDPRDPCPVDRVVFEAVAPQQGATVHSMDPLGLAPGADSRRVQSFVVPPDVARVRVRLMGLNNQVRYEAVVDAGRLSELPAPAGTAAPNGFRFDLAQYPAR